MTGWKRNCETCDNKCICASYDLTENVFCGAWMGWIPASVATPDIDDYVLVQLTEEYAGEDNITIGMYFQEDKIENLKPQWYTGHICLSPIEDNEVYAWRPLPKPIKEI